MDKLTEEQVKMVEGNHNLIYWYLNKRGLEYSEYYDLLAIVLCETAVNYLVEKGSFSTYFKIRADSAINKEVRKLYAQKRIHCESVTTIDENYNFINPELERDIHDPYNNLCFKELLNGEYGEVLKLVYEGYTQTYIAKKLNITQSEVSRILKRIRKAHND